MDPGHLKPSAYPAGIIFVNGDMHFVNTVLLMGLLRHTMGKGGLNRLSPSLSPHAATTQRTTVADSDTAVPVGSRPLSFPGLARRGVRSPEDEIEMTPSNITTSAPTRAQQQDARAWAKFTGCNYTAALRQMQSPLAQGLLGERVSARHLIKTLEEHELLRYDENMLASGEVMLGPYGYISRTPFTFNGERDYIDLAVITEVLRMFTPTPEKVAPEIASSSMTLTAEWFLSPLNVGLSDGQQGKVIWAAAAMGLPLSTTNPTGYSSERYDASLWIGVSEREHDYVRRMVAYNPLERPNAHHHRPAGYGFLREVLPRAAAGEFIIEDWAPPATCETETPFHDWLTRQTDRRGRVGTLATDYVAGVHDSDHGIAATPGDLLTIFNEIDHSDNAYDSLVRAITEYMSADLRVEPVRTRRNYVFVPEADGTVFDEEGFYVGEDVELDDEFLCPCGFGTITETNATATGTEERSMAIDCDRCSAQWRFAEGRSTRDWGLIPKAA